MVKFFKICAIGVLFAEFGIAPAQNSLTVDAAVKIALQKNKELMIAKLEVGKADARVSEAWGSALPALDFSGRYMKPIEKMVMFLPGSFFGMSSDVMFPLPISPDHSFDFSFTARQILFNSAVFTGVGASSIYAQTARELYRSKQIETVTKVRKAFYGLLLAGEVHEMLRQTLANAENNLKNVQSMTSKGLVSDYDELRATVGVENLRPGVIQSENNFSLALDNLRNTMGVDSAEQFTIEGSLEKAPMIDPVTNGTDDILRASNATLSALKLQIDVNKAFKKIQQSDYMPTLAAFGTWQYQMAKNGNVLSTGDFQRSIMIGLSLTMNIFSGLQTNARVEQAELEVRKSEELYASVENGLKLALHSQLMQVAQARRRIDAQTKTVGQAERGYSIASSRFVNGLGTQLEVNDAQLALTQAKVNRMQAVFDYLNATADLDQLLGKLPEYVTQTM